MSWRPRLCDIHKYNETWTRLSVSYLETRTRKWQHLNKMSRFPIFCDKTKPKTSGKINRQMSPRPRLINNQFLQQWIKRNNFSKEKSIKFVDLSFLEKENDLIKEKIEIIKTLKEVLGEHYDENMLYGDLVSKKHSKSKLKLTVS